MIVRPLCLSGGSSSRAATATASTRESHEKESAIITIELWRSSIPELDRQIREVMSTPVEDRSSFNMLEYLSRARRDPAFR